MSIESEINNLIRWYIKQQPLFRDDPNPLYKLSPTRIDETIEDEMTYCFQFDTSPDFTGPIERWIWVGEPTSWQLGDYHNANQLSLEIALEIDNIIWNCSMGEGLSSPSVYIREFKKWQRRILNDDSKRDADGSSADAARILSNVGKDL